MDVPVPGAGPSSTAELAAEKAGRSKAQRIVDLAQQLTLTNAERGEVDMLLDRHLNTNSPALLDYLYGDPPLGWGFPKRYIKDGVRNTTRLARSIDALLANYRLKPDRRLELCLLLSDRLTQLETLRCKLDKDGRIRYSLNIVGTKVGRMSCHASNTGSGYNLHGVQPAHRKLFRADPGHDLYQVDLSGADTWTVAAECRALGDPTMWDDLQAGIKPAKVLSLLFLDGPSVNNLDRPILRERCNRLPKDWLYDAAKKCCHGSAYGEGEVRMAETILRDSWESGTLATVTAQQCRRLQSLYFTRYPGVRRWQERVRMLLAREGYLTAASGLRRDFFGRKDDHQTHKDAYPFCPAANTAWACNCALLKLWRDPARSERAVQPLLTVHDSVLFQAPVEHRAWVAGHIPAWFTNPLTVAGTTFSIPFECGVGPSWGELQPLTIPTH